MTDESRTQERKNKMIKRDSWLKRLTMKARVGWSIIGITLLLIVLLEAGLSFAFWINDRMEDDPEWLRIKNNRAFADGYGQAGWTEDYFIEFEESNRTQWHSYVYWRRRPFQGNYINIDKRGLRSTWNADRSKDHAVHEPVKIFMFGGSALWGTGVRDDFTVPSCLARFLEQHGLAATITNFGESGYVNTQEMIALQLEIQQGNLPDLVILYDGVNDVYSAYSNRRAGIPQNEENRIKEFNTSKIDKAGPTFMKAVLKKTSMNRLVQALLRRVDHDPENSLEPARTAETEPSIQRTARAVLSSYMENVRIIRCLGQERGFNTLFYWQPIVFMKDHLTDYEAGALGDGREIEELYAEASHLAAEADYLKGLNDFHDLCGIFKDRKEPVFIDWCHVTEEGNRIIAERMGADVLAALSYAESK